VTLPAEATGSAPGRGRLTGRRVLVVGAGTRPSPEPDPPIGNGRAISVLAAREGAAVACADRDAGAAEATAALVRDEGKIAAVVLADVASPDACASVVAESAASLRAATGIPAYDASKAALLGVCGATSFGLPPSPRVAPAGGSAPGG
jgi:NAD(P)-dependent dehydrogenase (short-subunit alcohol dehydrogenase family)